MLVIFISVYARTAMQTLRLSRVASELACDVTTMSILVRHFFVALQLLTDMAETLAGEGIGNKEMLIVDLKR